MPTDEFQVASPTLMNYAEQLLIDECTAPLGYDRDVPWQDTRFPPPENFNVVWRKIFTPETAREWGYMIGGPGDPKSAELWRGYVEETRGFESDPEFGEAVEQCVAEVRDPDSIRDEDNVNYVQGLKTQAIDVAATSPEVRSAIQVWRECMEDATSIVVPDAPNLMPPPEQQEAFEAERTDVPSDDEVELAVADADCRESSGYAAAQYEAEWNAEAELVAKNRQRLERIRDDAEAHRAELLAVIAEHAPAE